MKGKSEFREWGQTLCARLRQYRYVCLVLLVGIVLLNVPLFTEENSAKEAVSESALQIFDLSDMEEELAQRLTEVEGAGRVSVMLTVKTGPRQILAQDAERTEGDGKLDHTAETVVISKGSGQEDTVVLQQIGPQFQGALIVCPGGADPTVRLQLVEAVSALTGLGADRISICKGK